MISQADLKFISILRQNARETLTSISKRTGIPVSTLYEKLKKHEEELILKHTTLLDFSKLGYMCRANILLRTNRESREKLGSYLKVHQVVNNMVKINNGYDYMIEGVFVHIKQLEDFLEELEESFPIEEKKIHYVICDVKREEFLIPMM
ncbi:hypothetical protein JW756_04435 [Candidatus Woesearchaeota archaeon]|nr:hypothetical protein [Candidatus Woesearchaeota archaeon]